MKRFLIVLVVTAAIVALLSAPLMLKAGSNADLPPGEYQGVHRHWTDRVIFSADGTYKRAVNGDPGRWTYDGSTLILRWAKWQPETLVQTEPGKFTCREYKFTLTALPAAPKAILPPGEYQGVHRHWTDRVIFSADGTYKRAVNGDPGRWTYDGSKLILRWAKWQPETLVQTEPGKFTCREYKFTLTALPAAQKAILPPGVYQGVHRHWRDRVVFNADGTYKRAVNGDPGRWTYDGSKLILRWAKWQPETLVQTAPGKFTCREYPFTLTGPAK